MTAADTVKDLHVQVKRCPECGTGFGLDGAFCPFDGVALQTGTWDPSRDPLTGAVIDNRYEVIEALGEGGMGTVYKVRHTTLDRLFAMKVLRRDLAADGGLAQRFLQEARATAAVRHPHVVAINDFGTLDDGAPYFVMELLTGETLATRLRARGFLPPSEAVSIAAKLSDALGAAHAANVVHRDLKPENVFLVGSGARRPGSAASPRVTSDDIRIVDFGAAKIVGGSKLTRPGVVFGTPYYMSPEQASGAPIDARADVYSLGVLLYEMLTGRVPFEADTYMGVLTKHMFAAPVRPSERMAAGVQLGELEDVVLRALEKEPQARFASMEDFGRALRASVRQRPSSRPSAGPPLPRTGTVPMLSTAAAIQRSVSRHDDEEKRRKQRIFVVAVVSAAATLGMCALAVGVIRDADGSKAARAESAARAPTPAPSASPSPLPAASPLPSAPTLAAPSVDPSSRSIVPEPALAPSERPPATRAPSAGTPASAGRAAPPGPSPVPGPASPSTSAPPAARRSDDLPDPWKR